MLDKLLDRLKSERVTHAVEDVSNPAKRDSFQYGLVHGKQVAFSLVEQWIAELLEEQEDDESE